MLPIKLAIGTVVIAALFSSAEAKIAGPLGSFLIPKAVDKCVSHAQSNVEIGQCSYSTANSLSSKMKDDSLCTVKSCIVRILCKDKVCKGGGYSIAYKWDSDSNTGNNIHIKLASGRSAEYYQCGTCNDIEPKDKSQIPLALLVGDGVVFLEFETKYK